MIIIPTWFVPEGGKGIIFQDGIEISSTGKVYSSNKLCDAAEKHNKLIIVMEPIV